MSERDRVEDVVLIYEPAEEGRVNLEDEAFDL